MRRMAWWVAPGLIVLAIILVLTSGNVTNFGAGQAVAQEDGAGRGMRDRMGGRDRSRIGDAMATPGVVIDKGMLYIVKGLTTAGTTGSIGIYGNRNQNPTE